MEKENQVPEVQEQVNEMICIDGSKRDESYVVSLKPFEKNVQYYRFKNECKVINGPKEFKITPTESLSSVTFTNQHSGYRLNVSNIPIKLFDYKYKIRLELEIKGYLTVEINKYDRFIDEVSEKRLGNLFHNISTEQYNDFILRRAEPIIKRSYIDIIKKEEISVLESIKNFTVLNEFISSKLNAYFVNFGMETNFLISDIKVKPTEALKALNSYILEANRMKKLKYNYPEEHNLRLLEADHGREVE